MTDLQARQALQRKVSNASKAAYRSLNKSKTKYSVVTQYITTEHNYDIKQRIVKA